LNATSGSDQLYGWIFDVNAPIDVTDLGVGDTGSDGLAISHDVGIYRVSDQVLVASAVVPGGVAGALLNGFRYASLGSSVNLAADRYAIVMTMPELNADTQSILNNSVGTAPEVSYVTSAFDVGSSLHFPASGNNGAFAQGMFGPNFQFQAAAVPEASSLALLCPSLLLFGGMIARNKRRSRKQ
jgi:hypothetical protein